MHDEGAALVPDDVNLAETGADESGWADTYAASDADLSTAASEGAKWLSVVSILARGSQIVVTLGLAAMLSTREVGLVTTTTSMLNIVAMLQMMGVYDVVGRTRREPDRFAGTVITLSLLVSTLSLILGFGLADVIASALDADGEGNLLRLAFMALPFTAYAGVASALFSRKLDFRGRALTEGVSALLGSVVIVVLAWMGHGAYSSAWGVVVTAVTSCIIAMSLGGVIRPRLDTDAAQEVIRWASVVGPAAVIGLLMMNVDYMAVSRILGQSANGIYSLAFRIAYMPLVMIGAVVLGVAFQVFAELHRRGDTRALNRAVVDYMSVSGLVIIGLYSVMFAMADHLDLLGTKWGPSVLPMRILCLYGAFGSCAALALDALRAAGEKRTYLVSQLVQLVVLLPCLIFGIHHYDIEGAAWAQVAGAVVLFVFSVVSVRRLLHLSISRVLLSLVGPAAGALCVFSVYEIVGYLAPHHGPNLPAALGSGVLFVLAYLLGVRAADPTLPSRFVALVRGR